MFYPVDSIISILTRTRCWHREWSVFHVWPHEMSWENICTTHHLVRITFRLQRWLYSRVAWKRGNYDPFFSPPNAFNSNSPFYSYRWKQGKRFVSKQGHPQPHINSKARTLSPQLWNGLFWSFYLAKKPWGGGGVLPMIAHTGRLCAKEVSFSCLRYMKG